MSTNQIDENHCKPDYWKRRWVNNDIRFHKETIHP